ncbi:MAG: hypothetical protein ACRCUI_15610, partial [Polymorphobacter sp.]
MTRFLQCFGAGSALRLGAVLALFAAQPVAAVWGKAETPAFTLYAKGYERDLRAIAEQLQAFDALLRQLTASASAPPRARVSIYLVDDARDFQRVRGSGPGFDGFYTATPNTIAA